MKIQVKTKKMKCKLCKKNDGIVRFYILDPLKGVPEGYHAKCKNKKLQTI